VGEITAHGLRYSAATILLKHNTGEHKNRVLKPALRLGSRCKRPTSTDCTARCFLHSPSGLAVLHPLFYALQIGSSRFMDPETDFGSVVYQDGGLGEREKSPWRWRTTSVIAKSDFAVSPRGKATRARDRQWTGG
jgi:hypothetical protein